MRKPAANEQGHRKDTGRGRALVGGTGWYGRSAMRISVSSWTTTDEDIERSLSAILRAAQDISSQ